MDHHLAATLHHPKDGRSLFLQCASATFAFESASPAFTLLFLHHLRLSFMAGNHLGFVTLDLI